jgi:hypothetical protein
MQDTRNLKGTQTGQPSDIRPLKTLRINFSCFKITYFGVIHHNRLRKLIEKERKRERGRENSSQRNNNQ